MLATLCYGVESRPCTELALLPHSPERVLLTLSWFRSMIVRSIHIPYMRVASMEYRGIKVTSKGQVTLPKAIRERLRVSEGDYLQVELRGDELVLRPAPKQNDRELLREYAREHSKERASLEEIQKMLSGLPFSIAERVSQLREEEGTSEDLLP